MSNLDRITRDVLIQSLLRVKEKANQWKDKLDIRAYDALMNYQVEITD